MNIREMSNNDLNILAVQIEREKNRRKHEDRMVKIEAFHKAYNDLVEAGVRVDYYAVPYGDPTRLTEWDGFVFD